MIIAESVGCTIHEMGQWMDAWYDNKMAIAEKLAF
jgi:hypothetical protein